MTQTESATGLLRRTNRPRVYVVASLAGGTGSGMFLDVAYCGAEPAEADGLRVARSDRRVRGPAGGPGVSRRRSRSGNTYAALTELNHYSRPDTTFTAHYDERHGTIREKEPPFTRCYLVPGIAGGANPPVNGNGPQRTSPSHTPATIMAPGSRVVAQPGSRVLPKPGSRVMPALGAALAAQVSPLAAMKPYADAADMIRLNLFSPLGRSHRRGPDRHQHAR